ncbi:uncharacterized protein HMPREF1541_10609 [Cyphellophora europaea CBS 101466]|uniref:AB hydrolase-1 domain-containing protein n=1 Tax=Cyphellophora europaea (strain CBS 101466) TaxID=1220924 RepID=W2S8T7_CYPE1|nr:uncharacterized protein HMPREF1541_10609 [Cyphellophora europaea CBS 101466]ETN44428.1 hypothetical protein HMPREF1541_10609 [Cyphellophora europaea CBS 101466]
MPKPTTGSTTSIPPPKPNEALLPLPPTRQLHYATTGPPTSRTAILFFSGYLSIGTADHLPAPLATLSPTPAHWIAPTLPGNGESSPTARGLPYHTSLVRDMCALLQHLYPAGPEAALDALYVAGGSYGSVAAQTVYGASREAFPWGAKVRGLLLLAPFSPFRLHDGYAREMTWANWVGVGPLSVWVPGRVVPRLASWAVWWMVRDVASAEGFMKGFVLGRMGGEERRECDAWLGRRGLTEEMWIRGMAEGAVRCVRGRQGGCRGFLEGPDVLHSDWGFDPREMEGRAPVLVVGADEDDLGLGMCRWLRDSYPEARLKVIQGGHVAAIWKMDEIWEEMLEMASRNHGPEVA